MITWPKSLVTEIARQRCILFLGAGVAASSKNSDGKSPKEWGEFLVTAVSLVQDHSLQEEIRQLISQNKFLLALQAIRQEANPGDYKALLDECFNDPTFEPSALHKAIYNLDSRLVITTNFDNIYEKHCITTSTDGFKVIPYYSTSLGDEIRSDTSLVIKAHGSINEIPRMVFTKAEYHRAKAQHSSFYAILKALFLTNTCIFIGCGMDDPDVLLLLEEVRITASPDTPHYALLKQGKHSKYIIDDLASAYNVRTLEYGPSHDDLIKDLQELKDQIDAIRSVS